jgi:FkbM family methyltransferase
MSESAFPLSGELHIALARLGRDPKARRHIIRLLQKYETRHRVAAFDVREEVTGPIVDALHDPSALLSKELADGSTISFRYTSKISRDFVMATDLRPDHVWEPQTTRTLLDLCTGDGHVIVGGAYIGDHAILIAKGLGSQSVCHCFEPSSDSIELLRLNVLQNSISNIRINHLALWSTETARVAFAGVDAHIAPQQAPADDPRGFPATTINCYADSAEIEAIRLIMLDVEGGELEALKGADRYLALRPGEAPHLIFEVHANYVDWSHGLRKTEIIRYIESFGYEAFAIRDYQSNVPMAGHPVELVFAEDVVLEGPPHGFNMLAVKQRATLERALYRFCRAVSPKLLFHRDQRLHGPLS